ncbi:MAG: PD-(D/E)XK nuclease family protein, partial [Bacteroidales bacterium]
DTLIVLSMNDGMFPSKRAANTFIPFNIREGFGLPNYKLQDSVFAYHFYRLIHRAKRVFFFYDTRAEGLNSGEVSRYVHQLRYHYRIESFVETQLSYDVSHTETSITIDKTEEVMNKLSQFLEGGTRRLSASSINTYIDCPLKFFYSVVENIRESKEVNEEIEYDMFGSLFHRTMETLYKGLENKVVTSDLLKQIAKDDDRITQVIEYAFAKDYFNVDKPVPLKGRNFMIGEIIRNYVKKILEIDAKLGVFTYLESERSVDISLSLDNIRSEVVQLKAIIDRLDQIGEITRVVDYKSGKAEHSVKSLADLFDSKSKDRRKAIMQVMLYSLVLWLTDKNPNTRPCIYSLRNIYNPSFNPSVICNELGGSIENFAPYREQFTDALRSLLTEIFDPDVPFSQTEISDHCKYCDFAVLCRK